jgi:hypothetical protein
MNMKQRLLGIGALALTLVIGAQSAFALPPTSTTGTVAVTATTVGSVSLTFVSDGAGIALGNSGTPAATIALGTLQAFGGTTPNNVTFIPSNGTSYGVSTPFDVVVAVANQESANYTLTAALQNDDAVNTWVLGGIPLTTTPATLTTTGAYESTPYTFTLTIPLSAANATITNTMNFVATAN